MLAAAWPSVTKPVVAIASPDASTATFCLLFTSMALISQTIAWRPQRLFSVG
jgi:hypothetical protein